MAVIALGDLHLCAMVAGQENIVDMLKSSNRAVPWFEMWRCQKARGGRYRIIDSTIEIF